MIGFILLMLIYIITIFFCFVNFAWGNYLWDFTYDDLEDTWNKINKYLSLLECRQTLKYTVSGFTAPIRIWIYAMLPAVRACGFVLRKNRDMPRMKRWSEIKKLKWVDVNKIFSKILDGQPPRQNMLPSDGEMTSCYYMSFQEYVYGERKSVPSPVRDHFRRQDESSSSMSSSGRSHGRGGRSGKHNLEEVLKRLHALEQHVFTNRDPREVFVEEVNNENLWNNISFEEPVVFQKNLMNGRQDELEKRNDNAGNKFDDDVFDVNDYKEAKEVSEEDEVIITGNVDYYDAYVAHDTEAKKKIDIKSTSLVPPSAFVVVHDFFVLRLQPYVAGGEVVIHNYLFHSYDVQHRLFNFVLDRDFGAPCLGIHTTDGQDWRAFMASIATYPNFMIAWWDVDTVLFPTHSSPNHWLFGELRLTSMEVHIYDNLGKVAYGKFNSDGTITKFESRVANYLDKINYWARRNIPRIPLNMQFIFEKKCSPTNVYPDSYHGYCPKDIARKIRDSVRHNDTKSKHCFGSHAMHIVFMIFTCVWKGCKKHP
uniref:Ubiquitin-like protease family profile domain-containing protein n=1 Tax=Lactuca sativa TaxID=4236 RepID=A0A9R1XJJ6_LACSA|nr:hypothetical protein LSAT_V11C300103030 [Lactuca sativa]